MVFNPILQSLQQDLASGYSLNGKNFITAPYADDFTLITSNKRTHQKLMKTINEKIKSTGMKIKPTKCRTFSISSSKPSKTTFHIEDNQIPTIEEEEQKFLGRVLFFSGKSQECFNLLEKTNQTKTG